MIHDSTQGPPCWTGRGRPGDWDDPRNWCDGKVPRQLDPIVGIVAHGAEQHTRKQRLHRMSPEARTTYNRIRKLREEIGPLDFDVVEALRELRG